MDGRQYAPRGRGGRGGGRGDRGGGRGDRGGGGGGGRGRGRGRGRPGDARTFEDARRNGGRGSGPGAAGKRGGGGGGDDGISLDEGFCMSVQKQLQELVEDGARFEMSFPTDLDNTQRRYIHSVAEKFGLFSKSSGKGDKRFVHVAKAKKNARMEHVSLRLQPIPVAGLPPAVSAYLSKFPAPPSSTTAGQVADQWSGMTESAHAALAPGKAIHQRGQRSLFRPLKQESSSKKQPSTAGSSSSSRASNLPVYSYKQQILELVEANQVVVISGDTGCGKSTQIPQFLLDDAIAKGSINNTRIICTQPRRLSAISLAERVAKERPHGSGNSQEVGHAIRFDSSFSADKSKLIFCTTGTLLKWLNNDPLALGFSHLILDEVHERDQFTDFLLILLKSSILKQRKDLKVILMSATIQVEKFSAYFQPEYSAPILEMVGGRCFPVTTLFLEDVLALLEAERTAPFEGGANSNHGHARLTSNGGARAAPINIGLSCPLCGGGGFADEEAFGMHVATCFGEPPADQPSAIEEEEEIAPVYQEGERPDPADLANTVQHTLGRFDESHKSGLLSAYERQEDALSRDQSVDYDLLLQLLYLVDQQFPLHGSADSPTSKGAVLVFLPGWEEISFMERALLRSPSTSSKYEIALLHSRLSAQEQRRAFLTPPRGKRKLILATNIAETSLTIEDVVFVVDCGKSKQAHALATTSSSSFVMGLQTTWVARANCVQRTGRAGRVRAGICFRLFSRARYETAMKEFMLPELLTTPLEELMLQIKLLQFERKLHILDAKQFISQAMDAPSELSIDAALQRLTDMNALDRPEGGLTLFGWHLAHICTGGVPVQMGKLVLWSHVLGCFDAVLQTTSALSGYRDPFINFLGMTAAELRQVEMSKESFVRQACPQVALQSDHFALWKAFEAYINFPSRSFAQRDGFCARNMLHRPTLEQLNSIYRQLQQDMELLGMTPSTQLNAPTGREHPLHTLTSYLMALSAGMYPNVLFSRSAVSRNWTSKEKVKVKIDGSSMVAWLKTGKPRKPTRNGAANIEDDEPLEWLVYHEMMQSERTRLAKYATKLPSTLLLMLLMGNPELVQFEETSGMSDTGEPERRWLLVLDDWFVFEFRSMDAGTAVLTIRDRLRAAFYRHLDRLHAGSQNRGHQTGLSQDPHEEKQKALLQRISGSVARLNEVLKEINAQIEKSDAFREDLAFTCQVWKGYENRVQSHCTVAADASAAGASSAR